MDDKKRCKDCSTTEGLSYVADPYLLEVLEYEEKGWFCESCYEDRLMEI